MESSAEQVVAALNGVHHEYVEFFIPTANKLIEEQGTNSLAAALAHTQPPSSPSLINHEQLPALHCRMMDLQVLTYGKFCSRDRSPRGSPSGQRSFRLSRGWGGSRDSDDDDEDNYGRGTSYRNGNSWSRCRGPKVKQDII